MPNRAQLAQMMAQQPQMMAQAPQQVMPAMAPQPGGGNAMQPIMDTSMKQRMMNQRQQVPQTFDPMNYGGQAGGIPVEMWMGM